MGWKLYGHAAVFGYPDTDGDIFAPGCFSDFLANADYLSIPMLNGHDANLKMGKWVRMHQDGFGLFVIGELDDNLPALTPPYPGLSIKPVKSQGSPFSNAWGGKLCRTTWIEEISILTVPANPAARVMGPW